MIKALKKRYGQNFAAQWIWICVAGYTVGGIIGVAAGGGSGYFLGDRLAVIFNIPPEMRQFFGSSILAGFLVGAIADGLTGLFQWILLKNYWSNAKGWILADIIGSLIGTAIMSIAYQPVSTSGSESSQLVFLFCGSLVLTIPFINLLQGTLEWFVLSRDFPNSTGWIFIRTIARTIGAAIQFIGLIIRWALEPDLWGIVLMILAAGFIEGLVFGAMTGGTLESIVERKNEILVQEAP